MVERSWAPVMESLRIGESSPDPGGLSRTLIKPLVPIAFTMLGLQSLVEIGKQVRSLRTPQGEAPLAEEPLHVG